ncbi:hypothetical protein ACSSS7_006699 [Eimeria intestinalis]
MGLKRPGRWAWARGKGTAFARGPARGFAGVPAADGPEPRVCVRLRWACYAASSSALGSSPLRLPLRTRGASSCTRVGQPSVAAAPKDARRGELATSTTEHGNVLQSVAEFTPWAWRAGRQGRVGALRRTTKVAVAVRYGARDLRAPERRGQLALARGPLDGGEGEPLRLRVVGAARPLCGWGGQGCWAQPMTPLAARAGADGRRAAAPGESSRRCGLSGWRRSFDLPELLERWGGAGLQARGRVAVVGGGASDRGVELGGDAVGEDARDDERPIEVHGDEPEGRADGEAEPQPSLGWGSVRCPVGGSVMPWASSWGETAVCGRDGGLATRVRVRPEQGGRRSGRVPSLKRWRYPRSSARRASSSCSVRQLPGGNRRPVAVNVGVARGEARGAAARRAWVWPGLTPVDVVLGAARDGAWRPVGAGAWAGRGKGKFRRELRLGSVGGARRARGGPARGRLSCCGVWWAGCLAAAGPRDMLHREGGEGEGGNEGLCGV